MRTRVRAHQQHLWDDEIRHKANGGLNCCSSNIFNNLHNNNNNGSNGHGDGACIHNNHPSKCNGSDKLPAELFAISFNERMRRHSTMSHKIVIQHSNESHFNIEFIKWPSSKNLALIHRNESVNAI